MAEFTDPYGQAMHWHTWRATVDGSAYDYYDGRDAAMTAGQERAKVSDSVVLVQQWHYARSAAGINGGWSTVGRFAPPPRPKEYRIVWEIDVSAMTPEAAAREAQKIQRDPTSTATVFAVSDGTDTHQIDVAEVKP